MPASFFSAGAFPAGALPPVEGFFSAALGGISTESDYAKKMLTRELVWRNVVPDENFFEIWTGRSLGRAMWDGVWLLYLASESRDLLGASS